MVKVDIHSILSWIGEDKVYSLQGQINDHYQNLLNKSGKGKEYLGWLDLPVEITEELLHDLTSTAELLRRKSEVFVVIGIGGSYLGARAVIEALKHHFDQLLPDRFGEKPVILYAGQNLSEDYLSDLLDVLDRYDYSVNVISKSGTTTEPAIAFRILKNHLETKYGPEGARERIVATTDRSKGALRKLADQLGYKTYVVPDDVGGRYSVLTPVGLLPIAVAGFDIRKLVEGARVIREILLQSAEIEKNPATAYAASRYALYRSGKVIEILVNYLPSMQYFAEWWKQLYGESEGKLGRGIFPASVINTTDLHSLGQYIQEGMRILFETVISVQQTQRPVLIPEALQDLDQLNYLSGKSVNFVNQMAAKGTMIAHLDGGVPFIEITIPRLDEFHLGELIYFFEFACAISGYLLDVNPFDQPGVEAYKNNMFALLGKPGFETYGEDLRKRMQ